MAMGTWRTNNKALGLIEETQQLVVTDGTLNKQGEEIIKLEIKNSSNFEQKHWNER